MTYRSITVVVPCFDGERFLGEALESILMQKVAGSLDIVVGDDGSTDGSTAIAKSFAPAVRVVRHPGGTNRGISATRNLVVNVTQGEFIAFLDCDDIWLPGHLERLIKALEADPRLAFAVDNGRQFIDGGHDVGDRARNHLPGLLSAEELLLDQWFPPTGVLVRRAVLDKVGLFDTSMGHGEDQDLWLRILERYPAAYVGGYGYRYRLHDTQLSSSPKTWDGAERALEKALARYPYPNSVVRKRRAVIAYRRAEGAFQAGRPAYALALLASSALYDPRRAIQEAGRRLVS
ncbi:MAG: glycosyltransferase family A protein [Candidatus Competibacteraceae bacterium]